MNLDVKVLQFWTNQASELFSKKNHLARRYDELSIVFEWILDENNKIIFQNGEVLIENKPIKIKSETDPDIGIFGAAKNEMPKKKRLAGIETQIKKLGFEINSNQEKILLAIGGFDFNDKIVKNEYRIISNVSKNADDYNGSLASSGQYAWVNSHFSDNTYFFHFMKFVQDCKEKITETPENAIAMAYPTSSKGKISGEEGEKQYSIEEEKQKKLLEYRFPYKFLWMWANKDEVIHPFSLMAFRNFIKSSFVVDILKDKNLTAERLTNMSFTDFINNWRDISKKICAVVYPNENEYTEKLSNLSKLISILAVEESDMKNLHDLLRSSKQLIIYGAPGTGKTYSSVEIAKDFIVRQNDDSEASATKDNEAEFENRYRFTKNFKNADSNEKREECEHGFYEIIQFHPNYTYQDFIGGIAPNINGDKISYELKEGIFQRFCKAAQLNQNCNFVLIIDEINRANLSEVFGELLYALEYRDRAVNIPYFGEFTIPSNVYIIGTMNDVDKSLVTFDLALRRRFGFFKLNPDLDSLQNILSDKINIDSLSNYIAKCKKLNTQIIDQKELGLDKSYQIGQAYFLKIKNFLENKDESIIAAFEIEKLWMYHIEPLLKEYLGMSLESKEIEDKLVKIKNDFVKI